MSADTSFTLSGREETMMLEGSIIDGTRLTATPLGVWPGATLRRCHRLKSIFGGSAEQRFSSDVAYRNNLCPHFLGDRAWETLDSWWLLDGVCDMILPDYNVLLLTERSGNQFADKEKRGESWCVLVP
jgi:hypothetical protein